VRLTDRDRIPIYIHDAQLLERLPQVNPLLDLASALALDALWFLGRFSAGPFFLDVLAPGIPEALILVVTAQLLALLVKPGIGLSPLWVIVDSLAIAVFARLDLAY
jgi:hypothetical protein